MTNKSFIFERNLLALSRDPALCARLSAAETTRGHYRFLESRSGETVPALVEASGAAHPLHSLVDARREARRLVEQKPGGFIIIFGLGGGYYAEAALERAESSLVLAVDYGADGAAELLCSRDFIPVFGDPRFHLLLDPAPAEIERFVLDTYQPVLSGGVQVVPNRTRTQSDAGLFAAAAGAVESALAKVHADYSVQAHFGTRWFSNIVRNIRAAEAAFRPIAPQPRVAVTAAGPSLDSQLAAIKETRAGTFLLAVDTSLSALLAADIAPDAVVSIDCQHISYYHFMRALPAKTLLFLDLSSPPLAASRSTEPRFFAGGHPLCRYAARFWRAFPEVDTSGANVTYAACALAEKLGAREITLYGADFAYPAGASYARGTYLHTLYEKDQNRLAPLETLFSALLYRTPLEKKTGANGWYYETPSLRFYRESLEKKSETMNAAIRAAPGAGAPIHLAAKSATRGIPALFGPGPARETAREFLAAYRRGLAALPVPASPDYPLNLNVGERAVLVTLLPAAAALQRRNPGLGPRALIEEAQRYCVKEIDTVVSSGE